MNKNIIDIKKFQKDNFLVIKNFKSKKKINFFVKEFLKCQKKITNPRDIHYLKKNSKKKLSSMHNIHLYSSAYKNYILRSDLRKIIKKLYGTCSNKIFNSSYFAKKLGVGLETKMHQDNAYFNLKKAEVLTCWIPVDKPTKKNGTLYYYKGSAKLGNLKHIPKGNLGASMCIENSKNFKKKINKFKKFFIDINPGDCVIHNGLVVHGSRKNLSHTNRRAFNFSLKSGRDQIDIKKFNSYKNKLKKFIIRKKND